MPTARAPRSASRIRKYEFTKEYGGQRMTDEQWQENFYANDDTYVFEYRDHATWPAIPSWYAPLFAK
jgi:hypothetical protein